MKRDWTEALWAVFFPKQCPFCGKTIPRRELCCADCGGALPWLREERELPGLDGAFIPFAYEGGPEAAVRRLKFHGCTGRARSLAPYLAGALEGERFDCIVPIPMSRKGKRRRGYNQAELLARFLSRETGIPWEPALEKVQETAEQHTLSARERRGTLKGAYRLRNGAAAAGRSILLCDDVATTGATFREAAETLRRAGASRVAAAAVCKTRRSGPEGGAA